MQMLPNDTCSITDKYVGYYRLIWQIALLLLPEKLSRSRATYEACVGVIHRHRNTNPITSNNAHRPCSFQYSNTFMRHGYAGMAGQLKHLGNQEKAV